MTTNSTTLPAELYTDGACSGNPGPGGWAAVLSTNGEMTWYAGHEERTTNNRMEILGVIKGLEHVAKGVPVTVFSDSQYVVFTMTRGWQKKANQDLWQKLDALVRERKVAWEWVKGHADNPLNEEANRLAQAASVDANWGERSGSSNEAESTPVATAPIASKPTSPKPAPTAAPRLSHLDDQGNARMVDVSDKDETDREAIAQGVIYMSSEALSLILSGNVGKGDVFTVAQVAGIMAAKRTSDIIPMCHPLPLTQIALDFRPNSEQSCVDIVATVRTSGKTGVEMEALTAVSAAALTIYDMCKAVDRSMHITDIRVIRKSGGKTGVFEQA